MQKHRRRENWDKIQFRITPKFCGKLLNGMIAFLIDSACVDSPPNIEIGITESQFDQIINDLNLAHSEKQNQALRLYLEKLRHGHTFEQMAFQHNCHCQTIAKQGKMGRGISLGQICSESSWA